jgi:hypothetical protein
MLTLATMMILISIVLLALYSQHKVADQLSAVRSSFNDIIFNADFHCGVCVTTEMPFPNNWFLAGSYSLVKGDQYFEPGPNDVDASKLYPDVKYTTVDKFLNRYM